VSTDVRARIRGHLARYPGLTANEIARVIGQEVRKALAAMARDGEVSFAEGPMFEGDQRTVKRWSLAAGDAVRTPASVPRVESCVERSSL
jgi:hypothetical protein